MSVFSRLRIVGGPVGGGSAAGGHHVLHGHAPAAGGFQDAGAAPAGYPAGLRGAVHHHARAGLRAG